MFIEFLSFFLFSFFFFFLSFLFLVSFFLIKRWNPYFLSLFTLNRSGFLVWIVWSIWISKVQWILLSFLLLCRYSIYCYIYCFIGGFFIKSYFCLIFLSFILIWPLLFFCNIFSFLFSPHLHFFYWFALFIFSSFPFVLFVLPTPKHSIISPSVYIRFSSLLHSFFIHPFVHSVRVLIFSSVTIFLLLPNLPPLFFSFFPFQLSKCTM